MKDQHGWISLNNDKMAGEGSFTVPMEAGPVNTNSRSCNIQVVILVILDHGENDLIHFLLVTRDMEGHLDLVTQVF